LVPDLMGSKADTAVIPASIWIFIISACAEPPLSVKHYVDPPQ
jgi:hypothetical protein